MPNDCWSELTITADEVELNNIFDIEFKQIPEWAISINVRKPKGATIRLWSPWEPNFNRLKQIIQKYKTSWIKNIWKEEGGTAGVWIGTYRGGVEHIKELRWDDLSIEEENHRFYLDIEAPVQKTMN